MTPTFTTRLASESVREFEPDGDEVAPLKTREAAGFAGVERDLPDGWLAALGVVGHVWHEPGQNQSTLGGSLRIGKEDRTGLRLAQAALIWTGVYRRAEVAGELHTTVGPVRLRPAFRFGWGEQLPPQLAFALGGEDGFPGLHIGERRGDRELVVDVLLTYRIRGPLVARLELGAGRSALGGPILNDAGWLAGGRIGLGAETSAGPVRFEYGLIDEGRGAFFIRLGRWF
jgi:hypothetical protein